MGLALRGYYYTAVQLESRVVSSTVLLAGAMLMVNLVIRGIYVTERQLRMRRAQERRRAATAAKAIITAAAGTGEGVPETLELPEIDLQTINENVRRLLYLLVIFGMNLGLWVIWADTLPALHILNDVVLWQAATTVGSQADVQAITL
jgi:potassium efflux system protein